VTTLAPLLAERIRRCLFRNPPSPFRLSRHRLFRLPANRFKKGQLAEAGLEACDWITEIARRLDRGFVLTIEVASKF